MADETIISPHLTYHDLHITTPTIERTSIFNLPYRVQVTCSRVGGWRVWARAENLAGMTPLPEEDLGTDGLRLDVAGHVIYDSMPNEATPHA